jgi:hypothetical protein
MVSQFILIKSENEIINVADIQRVGFTPAEIEHNETVADALLEILISERSDAIEIEGDDAERIYLALIKSLPNLITI